VPSVVGTILIEVIISVAARWPYQFGGHGNRHHVLSEFVSSGGTALAPPLVLLIVLALIAVAVQRTDRWRTAATVLLIPVAAIMTVGAAGEAAAKSTPDVPRAVLIAGGLFGILLSVSLFGLAVTALTTRRARHRVAVPRGQHVPVGQ